MPKTFTDDVAGALPSAIEGPLAIVDPADPTSIITIDPAQRRIAAEGGASPTRSVFVPFLRQYATATATFIGQTLACHQISSITSGGYHAAPLPLPPDMNLDEPSHVRVLVATFADDSGTGEVVRLSLGVTAIAPGQAAADSTINFDWTVPDNWLVNNPRLVLIDNGAGRTFDGGAFAGGTQLGLRIARLGAATEDTFDKSLSIVNSLVFDYTAKEF